MIVLVARKRGRARKAGKTNTYWQLHIDIFKAAYFGKIVIAGLQARWLRTWREFPVSVRWS